MSAPTLPVEDALPALDLALEQHNAAVLVAPPGAGKTTLVPLHLLKAPWRNDGTIIVLEPRRLAARAASRRMASLLNEQTGQTVGYRMRLDNSVSANTRILVVTEGVFARMILDDPELKGVAAVLFDEFHERSLDADFGLALALDVQNALRPDLRILVMSATLDGARIAALLDNAPIVESKGRAYPVDIIYAPRPPNDRLEESMAKAIRNALYDEEGSILAFLPGQKEIERTKTLLQNLECDTLILAPLYGILDNKEQDKAIRPTDKGTRKIVLATAIAESSLTIDGVRIVIDCGLSRVPFYEASTGMTRLETVRSSRASIDQRAGRAGRTSAGICIRLWNEGQTAALPPFSTPEILAADLSTMLLDSAAFGIQNLNDQNLGNLAFLDPPPLPALRAGKDLLHNLGALDDSGRISDIGKAMRRYSLPVRLSAMMMKAHAKGQAYTAAELAVVLSERGLGGNSIDLEQRLDAFRKDKSMRANKARDLVKRLSAGSAKPNFAPTSIEIGALLMDAWPDRVAKARGANGANGASGASSTNGRFILANGRGAAIDELSPLAKAPFLVIADLAGQAESPRILAAAAIDEATIYATLNHQIKTKTTLMLDPQSSNFQAREKQMLGAIVLSERTVPLPKGDDANQAILETIRASGRASRHISGLSILPWTKGAESLRKRLSYLYRELGSPWPDMSDDHLLKTLDEWLLPFLSGKPSLQAITEQVLCNGLRSLVPYDKQAEIDKLAPTHFSVPTGSHIAIQYDGDAPQMAVRVQELYGLNQHPTIAMGKIPIIIELLSPAQRPIQITGDLPAFWTGSWKDVRADMRGRYPRHLWPEDPQNAEPTRRVKPRGS